MGSTMSNTKICVTCNRELPATLEHFYYNKNMKYKLVNECKDCRREYALERLSSMTPEARKKMKDDEARRNRDTYRERGNKARAVKQGVHHERWTEKQLLEAYGLDCYICHDSIDLSLPRRGPGSDYSFWPDHVIPISRGGEDTIKNVRPCHRKCNQAKFNKTYDEYMESLA